MVLTHDQAWQLLTSKVQSQNLRRHCLAVEAVMRALAKRFEAPVEKWGIIGLLHDGDYELTKDKPSEHTLVMHRWLRDLGVEDPDILCAVLSHNAEKTGHHPPATDLEWSLYCCDELTGFIVAVALILPSKRLADVTVGSVIKKFSQKAFAAAVDRSQIARCEEKLGIKLEDFVTISLTAMQSIAPDLGL